MRMEAEKTNVITSNHKKNERMTWSSFVFWSLVGFVLIGLDQITKYLAFHGSFGNFLGPIPGMRKLLYLNNDFAFSLPLPLPLMFAFYALILFLIIRYLAKNWLKLGDWSRFAWTLILAGAISNIVERVVLGYVRDFVYILSGIFNLADGCIVAGVIILLIASFGERNKERKFFNDKNEQN